MIRKNNIFDILSDDMQRKLNIKSEETTKIKQSIITNITTHVDFFEIISSNKDNDNDNNENKCNLNNIPEINNNNYYHDRMISSKLQFNLSISKVENECNICIKNNKADNDNTNNTCIEYNLKIEDTFNYSIDTDHNILIWIDIDYKRNAHDIYQFYYCVFDNNEALSNANQILEKFMSKMNINNKNAMSLFLESLLKKKYNYSMIGRFKSLGELLKLDKVKQESISNVTQAQSLAKIWFAERRLRLTASNFGKMVKRRSEYEKLAYNLINQEEIKVPAMEYGHKMETKAREAYEKSILKNNKVITVGLIVSLDDPWLGGSPDGFVNEELLIEIKCPYRGKDLTNINDLVKSRSDFCLDKNGLLKVNHDYFYQIQGLMHITARKNCDFIIYTPKFMHITKIEYDSKFWNVMRKPLSRFYHSYYIIELIKSDIFIEDDIVKCGNMLKALVISKPNNKKIESNLAEIDNNKESVEIKIKHDENNKDRNDNDEKQNEKGDNIDKKMPDNIKLNDKDKDTEETSNTNNLNNTNNPNNTNNTTNVNNANNANNASLNEVIVDPSKKPKLLNLVDIDANPQLNNHASISKNNDNQPDIKNVDITDKNPKILVDYKPYRLNLIKSENPYHNDKRNNAVDYRYEDYDDDKDNNIDIKHSGKQTIILPNYTSPLQNKTFAQSKLNHRVFLTKRNKIYAMSFDDDLSQIKDKQVMSIINPINKIPIDPKKLILNNNDKHMVFINALDDNKKLFLADIETSKVIQELKGDGENTMQDIANMYKTKECAENPCILAINSRNIFQMDPRIHHQNKCISKKIYTSINNFNSLATNDLQFFALGSGNGEIRYYKGVGHNATILDKIYEPIISIDSTKDAKLLLITTPKELILAVTYDDTKYAYIDTSLRAQITKFKITITHEHRASLNSKNWTFTPAKFDYGEIDDKEKYIITSIGKMVLKWKIEDILKGKNNNYEMINMDSIVLCNEFIFDSDQKILSLQSNRLVVQTFDQNSV